MRTAIIALVAVITAIGVTVLCIPASVNSNKILKEMIKNLEVTDTISYFK